MAIRIPFTIFVYQGAPLGERIATPVCGLVRNDIKKWKEGLFYSPRIWVIIWSTRIRQRGTWKGPLKVEPLQAGWVGLPSRRR